MIVLEAVTQRLQEIDVLGNATKVRTKHTLSIYAPRTRSDREAQLALLQRQALAFGQRSDRTCELVREGLNAALRQDRFEDGGSIPDESSLIDRLFGRCLRLRQAAGPLEGVGEAEVLANANQLCTGVGTHGLVLL